MTPSQKIKHAILNLATQWGVSCQPAVTVDNVDALYDALVDQDGHWDAESEIREGDEDTGLPCEYSRHYESKSVAAKMPDGSWVGWTYWYGGGKHGAPDEIDWMGAAYDLNCVEEERLVTIKTFTKIK